MMYQLPSLLCRFAAMTFEEYLTGKKIDPSAFKAGEPAVWEEWNVLFEQISPISFTAQKLYLINPLRRKYLLKGVPSLPLAAGHTEAAKPAAKKPMFKPKIN